jgi:hypothetical protein
LNPVEVIMLELQKIAGLEIAKLNWSQDSAFRIYSRRNKLLGLWAASHLGMDEAEAEVYARQIVATGMQRGGNHVLIHRIRQDFAAHGVQVHESAIRQEMERLMSVAALEHGARAETPRSAAA